MDALLAPPLILAGFFVGTVFGTQMMRWGALLWVSTTTHAGDFLGPPGRRLLWVLPFVALLHPGLYLLALVVVITVWALQGKIGSLWLWALAGFYAYLVFASLSMLRAYRRQPRG